MAGAKIALSTTDAEFRQDAAGKSAMVNTPGNGATGATQGGGAAAAGMITVQGETDAGTVTGARVVKPREVSEGSRVRVGQDVFLDSETFNYSNQNTGKFAYLSTTLTMAQSSARLQTNATGITTINTAASYRTWQYFPIYGQRTPTYVETSAALSAALATNTTIDFGLFLTNGSSPYAPSDGCYFRITSAGFFGIVNIAGAETPSTVFTFTPTINRVYNFVMMASERAVRFYIDDVLYATVAVPVGSGQPFQSSSLPYQIRHAIGGTAAGSVLSLNVYDYSVSVGDVQGNLSYGAQMTGMGGSVQVQPAATTGGQLSTYALGAEPGAVTLTASTAPATNTLGGLFLLPAVITTAASDYPLFAWQNPAGTIAIQGKTFFCTGVRIGEMTVTTALTGGPIIFAWAVGFGSTASTLATTETTTFASGTTKIARKIPLGVQALAATAAVGTVSSGFQVDFSSAPLPVNPGEFLHIILRCLGTSTSAGAPRGSVAVLGYFR